MTMTTAPARPVKVSCSLTEEGGVLLDLLVQHMGGTRSTTIELAIRRLASSFRIETPGGQVVANEARD